MMLPLAMMVAINIQIQAPIPVMEMVETLLE